jgi:hypothetical protein
VKSSISIVLFFLLSGFFLSALLGALEHSRKLLGVAAACFVAVACVIAFLTPIQLPSWRLGSRQDDSHSTLSTASDTAVGTTMSTTITTEALGAGSR